MKILVFAASLRKNSLNQKLAAVTAELLRSMSASIDHADFREFEMPIYDGDLEERDGLPAGASKLTQRIQSVDALVISTPEYNGGIPGSLKNAIDWVSRSDPNPMDGKPVLLLGASPGGLGAVRGLWHTRVPLEAMGAFVYPEMFGLPHANLAFDEGGKIKDGATEERLKKLLIKFAEYLRN
jgi:NAD(P)H-dependent FMN reductase